MKQFLLLMQISIRALAGENEKPNVILFLMDDLGLGDIGVYNSKSKIPTPNLDLIAKQGFQFFDAHAASSVCSPSRYSLMTGRYSLEKIKQRQMQPHQPHLGQMFKKAGYLTALVGKNQPIAETFTATDYSKKKLKKLRKKKKEYIKRVYTQGKRQNGQDKYSFHLTGNYEMDVGPHRDSYDYSFLSRPTCCIPGGGFFENGKSIEPFDKWAIQKTFPENYPIDFMETKYGLSKRKLGYVGPPFFNERIEGPILVGNNPPSILVQQNYDSRYVEQKVNKKALNFIDEAAGKKEPFFLYYGMRASHSPFNSPVEYRNRSRVGVVGDNTIELDDNVGKIIKKLEQHNITDNTVVIVLSDNGADGFAQKVLQVHNHAQNSVDWYGEHVILKGFKSNIGEGGHRLPMLWKWPKGITPGLNHDTTVSYIDVYATLADIIGFKLNCNEAPDSRSLMPILNGANLKPNLIKPIIHHAPADPSGAWYAIRDGNWKFVDSEKDPQLYNLSNDLAEQNNLFKQNTSKANQMKKRLNQMVSTIKKREKNTKKGLITQCL